MHPSLRNEERLGDAEIALRMGRRALRLWYAVLVQAVEDYHTWVHVMKRVLPFPPTDAQKQAYLDHNDAYSWMHDPHDTSELSFLGLCDLFDIPPSAIHDQLSDPTFVERFRRAITHLERV
jgi:hypothetical protein